MNNMKKAYCPKCKRLLIRFILNLLPNALLSVKCKCGYHWKAHQHEQ